MPTSSGQGRERDLIDSTINTTITREKLEGGKGFFVSLRDFQGSLEIQYMRPLASIYSHRNPEFMETQVEFNSIQKRNSNPKRKVQPCLSVDRPVGRPMPRSTAPTLERGHFSRSTRAGQPLLPVHDRARRSTGRSTGLLHRSTGSTIWLVQCAVSHSLISDLCANFLYSSISSLPHNWHVTFAWPHKVSNALLMPDFRGGSTYTPVGRYSYWIL